MHHDSSPLVSVQEVPPEALWTIKEVAAYIGCTVRHVHNLIGGGLPHLYAGRLLRFEPGAVRGHLRKGMARVR